MEKIFEDKEFHGVVKFFKGIVNIVRGNPSGFTFNTSFVNFYTASDLNNQAITGCLNELDIAGGSSDTQFASVIGARNKLYFRNGDASNSWSGNYLVALEGQLGFGGDGISLLSDYISSVRAVVACEGGTATIPSLKNVLSGFNKWASGVMTISNYFSFYSSPDDKHANTTLTNVWHFYGAGDHPSYFGGEIQQVEKDITAATPPTQAEMVSELGAANVHIDASLMVKVTDGSHFRVFSNGTSWFYSAYTVGA